jgi:hypothetical protein
MVLEAAFGEFGGVLSFEARIFFGCVDLLGGVDGELDVSSFLCKRPAEKR